jgi:hypothetical protein
VDQVAQGVPEALGLSGSSAIVFDPPAWCGVARTLCGGHGDPLPKWRSSLVDAASR